MTAIAEDKIRINEDRLWNSLMEMATIGAGVAGGCNRQALTDADNEGRHRFQSWCEAAGLTLGVDQMGTMYATRRGTRPDELPVYVGSHLDTQPTGGKFDGVLGVLSALEVVRTLNDQNVRTERSIVIVNWTNEEGSRFVPSMLGSGVYAGIYSLDYAHGRKDQQGRTLGAELVRTGWLGEERVGSRIMHAYIEYHIEQGPILEAEGQTIGVVTHGQGQSWLEVTLTGREAHTGSTPMNMRANAGLAMARIFEMVHGIAMDNQPGTAGSIGQVLFSPNSRNVLPGKVVFTIDIRAVEKAKLDSMCATIEAETHKIAAALGVGCSIEPIGHYDPIAFDSGLVSIVRKSADKLGYKNMDIYSGAGHDACWVARVAPATMIMCPCSGGVSHNEAEEITREWGVAGANVLLHSLLATAGSV
ncbi:Zn-dependent hydrolase [Ketobacter sp. MCCC 1A13808]|uniref:Zn-dependent hydrolase n=1 Tax=Ketobacter sp. MCCC 1A13808 TaxID=2602738 RepID=UPI0012EC8C80|nr:Zn-dependent hydrolase [Ketobacter sp. MCCC 1A13808]MVF14819.1 Zn-dependent hydrolase [Ketobacter sp. MCCC 1A13808]